MKKALLFALIGAVILFAWQFLSFAMPNFHKSSMEYTPLQDEILAAIDNSGLKEGMYMLKEPDIWAYMLDGIVPWALLGLVGHRMA